MAENQKQYAIFRCEKLNTYGEVGSALAHANRKRETPNANRSIENQYLVQIPLEQIKERCESARTRKNNVLCYDIFCGASPEFFAGNFSGKKIDEWQHSSIQWLEAKFGKENIVNLVVHLDEQTPHITCQCLPIHEGKLNARHFTGGKAKMSALQDSYAEAVSKLGLERGERGSSARHESVKKYYTRVNEAETSDQLRVADFRVELDFPEKVPLVNYYKEDPRDYFERHFKQIEPKIQALLDENLKLRQENRNLRKEVSHWRSARCWNKKQADKFKKMQSDLFIFAKRKKELEQDMAQIKKINPKLVQAIQEREERSRF